MLPSCSHNNVPHRQLVRLPTSFSSHAISSNKDSLPEPSERVFRKRLLFHSRPSARNELTVVKSLSHENVVRLLAVDEPSSPANSPLTECAVVFEFCANGTLGEYSKRRHWCWARAPTGNRRPQQEILAEMREVFRGVIQGLLYLHCTMGLVHRDVKLANILITEHGGAKLADFELTATPSQCLLEKRRRVCGSTNYLAPEVFLCEGHSFASDRWALGVCLLGCCLGETPFEEASAPPPANDPLARQTVLRHCIRGVCLRTLQGKYLLPEHVPYEVRIVVTRLLLAEPSHRMTLDQLLDSDFIKPPEKVTMKSSGYLAVHQSIYTGDRRLLLQNVIHGLTLQGESSLRMPFLWLPRWILMKPGGTLLHHLTAIWPLQDSTRTLDLGTRVWPPRCPKSPGILQNMKRLNFTLHESHIPGEWWHRLAQSSNRPLSHSQQIPSLAQGLGLLDTSFISTKQLRGLVAFLFVNNTLQMCDSQLGEKFIFHEKCLLRVFRHSNQTSSDECSYSIEALDRWTRDLQEARVEQFLACLTPLLARTLGHP